MAQQQKRWEPPPFVLKKSQQQIEDENKWTPPPFVGSPVEVKIPDYTEIERPQGDIDAELAQNRAEENSTSLLERIYNTGSKGALDYLPESKQKYRPSELYKKATKGIREFGESGGEEDTFTNRVKKVARYGQAFGETFSGGLEEALNPINIGLMAISGGSSAAFKGAKGAKDAQNAQKLYQIGKALEFPGKVASGGMVAHGGYKAATGETSEEQVGGGIEALMGAAGLRFRGNRKYPDSINTTARRGGVQEKSPVNTKTQHGPKEQLYFPLRGRENPIRPGKFSSGPRGTYKEGDIVVGELGNVPASTAYDYGTVTTNKSGKPFVQAGTGDGPPVKPEVNTVKLEQIKQYMQAIQNKEIPEGTKFEDYLASIKPIVTTPDKPISFDEILPPTPESTTLPDVRQPLKTGAVFAFNWPKETLQDGTTFGGFPMYNVPVEGGMSTVGAEELTKMGYELPPIGEAMSRPESLPAIEPETTLPDVRQQTNPVESIGDEIINPTTNESTGIDLNEPTQPVRASDQWQEIVDELDARQAPDSEYRNILSTGSKEPLGKRETWRGRVQKYIQMDRNRNEPQFSRIENKSESPAKRSVRDILGLSDKMDRREFFRKVSTSPEKARQDLAKMFGPKFQQQINAEVDRLYPPPANTSEFDTDKFVKAVENAWENVANSNPQMRALKDIIDRGYTGHHQGKLMKLSNRELGFSDTGTGIIGRIAEELKSRLVSEMIDKEPQFARSEKGGVKISVNVERAADEVTTAYSGPLSGIMIREGGQNGLDAVRYLGTDGKVTFKITISGMEISDNGKGMNRQELETVFSNLNETGKVDEEYATGGKGVGKASYIMGGDHFAVSTVSALPDGNKLALEMNGNRESFLEHVDVDEMILPPETPTGTTIKTKFKKDQSSFDARTMLNRIVKFTRGLQTQISRTDTDGYQKEFKLNDGSTDTIIGKTKFHTGGENDVVIRIPKDTKLEERTFINSHFLNNGMYQFSGIHYLDMKTPDMPDDIIIDIHPHAKEGTAEYPFPTSRESVKEELQKDINKLISEVLVKPHQEKRKNILVELYSGFIPMRMTNDMIRPNGRNSVMFDSGNRLRPEEVEMFNESKTIQQLISFTDNRIAETLKNLHNLEWTDKLEGTGIVLDEGLYGIHIPNPTSDKSTILINYLAHALEKYQPDSAAIAAVVTLHHEIAHIGTENPDFVPEVDTSGYDNDPRVPRYLAAYLQQIQHQGGKDAGHGFAFAKRLGEVYARNGIKDTLDAITELTAIFQQGHKTGGYSPELQGLLQIYSNSRKRTAVTEDVLSRTGDKSKITGKGSNIPPEDSGSSGTGTSRNTIAESVGHLKEALVAGKLGRNAQDMAMSGERSKRAGMIAGVKTRGMAGYQQQLGMLRGPLPKAEVDSPLLDEDMDVLIDAISDNGELKPYQEISAKRGLLKLLMGEAPQNSEMALLSQVFGDPDLGGLVELHAGLGGISGNRRLVNNVLHLAKTMKASLDLSGSLRQGLPFIDRKEYWKAFWNMHKYLGSETSYQAGLEVMRSHPDFNLIMETPLFLAGFHEGAGQSSSNVLVNREEQFLSEWGDHIPLVKQSQRAFIGFLDELRFNVMTSLMNDARKLDIPLSEEITKYEGTKREMVQTISTPELDEIAKFVNIFTGRGGLGRFEKMAVEANLVLWSPKFLSSRLTILNPNYYIKASPFVQKQALKQLFVIAGAGLSMLALAKMNGGEVEYEDATSADFMKARFGNTRFDPWAGLQQNVVAEARILTYIRNAAKFIQGKPIHKNQKYRPGSGYNTRTARDITIDFAENKLSPLANFVSSMADLGKSYEPSGASKLLTDDWNLLPTNRASKEIINLYSPMVMDTIIDLQKDDPSLFPLGVASFYGSSIQTYDERIPGGQYRPRVPRLLP